MRSVAVMLTFAAVLATAAGCKRCGDATPTVAPGTSAAATVPTPASAPAPTPATAPAESPATELARPSAPWRPSVDCNKLLGAERASKLMGRSLVAVSDPTLAASECRYGPGGAAPDDKGPYVDVVYACREAAVHIARAVMSASAPGVKPLAVGQQGIVLTDGGSGVVQFLQRSSPCAVQVTTRPADKAVEVAREVERGLAALPVVQ